MFSAYFFIVFMPLLHFIVIIFTYTFHKNSNFIIYFTFRIN